jgi:nitroreductase/SAM-dependent methyltransferase
MGRFRSAGGRAKLPRMSAAPPPGSAGEKPAVGPSGGIPEEPEGSPVLADSTADLGESRPLGELPRMDFWEALYSRRSIRKFKPDPVPRALVDQVMHAGIWAPSSCNYQMWDLVAVDDPAINAKLAALSLQMSNAPVNIVVAYGRDFSEENHANIQSASALIENMSLAAHVLGLGTFWITQTGDAEGVREIVGLPLDRMVVAVLALGYPKTQPKKGPKRRPLTQVAHYNHYAGRPIPSSIDPEAWEPELLAIYQRARVLNGLRHNKPRAWEVRAIETCVDRFVPREGGASAPRRWLEVLPCTGIVTELLSRKRPEWRFDVVERTSEVASFVAERTRPRAGVFAWPDADAMPPPDASYDLVSCFFRLEDLRRSDRALLLSAMARWVAPGGRILLAYVSRRSFHDLTERARARRGGPRGVEYVLSPDPNIGPFQALAPAEVADACAAAGLRVVERLGLQAAPSPEELQFRARNFSPRSRRLVGGAGQLARAFERLPGIEARFGRFQFLLLEPATR